MILMTLSLGLIAAGLTLVIRAVVPQLWLLVKPFACDLCMSWWSAWLGAIMLQVTEPIGFWHVLPAVLGAVPVSVLLVKIQARLSD